MVSRISEKPKSKQAEPRATALYVCYYYDMTNRNHFLF